MSEYIFPQSDTLAESYPKLQNELIRQNEEDKRLQGEIDKHKDGNDHTADKVRYEGRIPKDNVKDALDETDTRIDNIVSQGGSDNTEVVDARHSTTKDKTFPVLKDRLEDSEQDIEKLKTDTRVVESVTETSYDSVISVPDSAVNGQVSGVVRGQTLTNELGLSLESDDGWTYNSALTTFENGTITINAKNGQYIGAIKPTNLKPNTVYTVCVDIIDNTMSKDFILLRNLDYGLPSMIRISAGQTGYIKTTFQTGEITNNRFNMHTSTLALDGEYIKLKNLMVLEGDHTDREVSYITGTKSTISAGRIKVVGKNLLNINNLKYYGRGIGSVKIDGNKVTITRNDMGAHEGVWQKVNVVPNQPYILSFKIEQLSGSSLNVLFSDRPIDLNSVPWYGLTTKYQTNYLTTTGYKTLQFTPTEKELWFATRLGGYNASATISEIQLEMGTQATDYESYKESNAYVIAKDEEGNILELRSLPNGTKDEIDTTGRSLIKKIGVSNNFWEVDWGEWPDSHTENFYATYATFQPGLNVDLGGNLLRDVPHTILNYSGTGAVSATFNDTDDYIYRYNHASYLIIKIPKSAYTAEWTNEETQEWFEQNQVRLIYQLAEPEIIPVRWTGLQAYENGTIYVDTVIPELGFYYDNGLESHYPDHPIKEVDTLYRVDKETGYREPLDVSKCTISEDRLSFTHPDLVDGDLCDWDYVPMTESTRPETSLVFPTNLKASVNSLLDGEERNKKEHSIFKARLDNHDRDIERIDDDIESIDADIKNVQSDIDAHKQDSNNPHNVTPDQIGAETPSGAQAKANIVQDDLNSHKNNYTTAHGIDVIMQDVSTIQSSIETSEQVTWSDPDILSSKVIYQKINGVVMITIFHNTLSATLDGYGRKTLFTLPASLRPAFDAYFPLTFDNGAHYAVIEVVTHGNVNILSRQGSEIPTNVAFRGTACYPVRR